MSALVVGRGRAQVELSGGITDLVDRMLAAAAPKTVAAITQATTDVLEATKGPWPVKTGRSLAGLRRGVRVITATSTSLVVEGFVDDPVPYVKYIKSKKLDGKNPFQLLIRAPLKARAKIVAVGLAQELLAAGRGGRRG